MNFFFVKGLVSLNDTEIVTVIKPLLNLLYADNEPADDMCAFVCLFITENTTCYLIE